MLTQEEFERLQNTARYAGKPFVAVEAAECKAAECSTETLSWILVQRGHHVTLEPFKRRP